MACNVGEALRNSKDVHFVTACSPRQEHRHVCRQQSEDHHITGASTNAQRKYDGDHNTNSFTASANQSLTIRTGGRRR